MPLDLCDDKVKISSTAKTLLLSMQEVNRDKRITWEELYYNELFNSYRNLMDLNGDRFSLAESDVDIDYLSDMDDLQGSSLKSSKLSQKRSIKKSINMEENKFYDPKSSNNSFSSTGDSSRLGERKSK